MASTIFNLNRRRGTAAMSPADFMLFREAPELPSPEVLEDQIKTAFRAMAQGSAS